MFIKTEKGWIEEASGGKITLITDDQMAEELAEGEMTLTTESNRAFIGTGDAETYEFVLNKVTIHNVYYYYGEKLLYSLRIIEGRDTDNLPFNEELEEGMIFRGWRDYDGSIISLENITGDLNLYAKVTPEYILVEDVKGGDIFTETMMISDNLNNDIVVPVDFKIAADSGDNISEGIVIEDASGNQFVWVPCGKGLIKADGSAVDIDLSRYYFDTSGNYTAKGLLDPIYIGNPGTTSGTYYTTEKTKIADSVTANGSANYFATDIAAFQSSVEVNGGYYIGRYEASGSADNVTIQYDKATYTSVTQLVAAAQAKSMYSNDNYTSDLINSLALDTAIVYIQNFGTNANYSNEAALATSKLNTGLAGDEQLKINDMAGNVRQWSTETSSYSSYPCVDRGGYFSSSSLYTAYRGNVSKSGSNTALGFRPLIYINGSDHLDLTKKLHEVVSIGDYVAYDAGEWTAEDLVKITESTGTPTVNGTTSLPTTQGQFGGFVAGQSRNSNSTTYNSFTPYFDGWRVWSIDGDEVTLVHAGHSESYYHVSGSSTESESILQNRDMSMYLNEYADSVKIMELEDYNYMFNLIMGTSYAGTDSYAKSITEENANSDMLYLLCSTSNKTRYWLATSYSSSHLYYFNGGSANRYATFTSGAANGVRPLIKLKANTLTKGYDSNLGGWVLTK